MIGRFSQWNVANLKTARNITYEVACNWKLIFLNYSECYHCPLVHPQLEKLSPSDSGHNDLSEGPFLGEEIFELREPGTSLTTSGRSSREPVGSVVGAVLQPNLLLYDLSVVIAEPTSRLRHGTLLQAVGRRSHGGRPALGFSIRVRWQSPDFNPTDVAEFWDLTNRQDWHVNEMTQLGLKSRAYTPGPYANAEGLLSAFDRHYLPIMATKYDAIVIGGGHNGLVTACYLARAKWKVLVLERRHVVGGACVTEEIFPGFKVSTAAYVNSLFRPEIIRDLRLHDYGFERSNAIRRRSRRSWMAAICCWAPRATTCEEIAQVQQDATRRLSRIRSDARARRRAHRADADDTPPNVLRPGSRDLAARQARPGVPATGPGDERGHRDTHRRGAAHPRSLVRIRASSKSRSRPTRSSAPSRRPRCPARLTCCSITSWARPTASAACGLMCAAAWAASPTRSPRRRRPRRRDPHRRRGRHASWSESGAVAGVALANGDEFRAARSPAASTADVTFEKLLEPATLPPDFVDGRSHASITQRVAEDQRRARALAELHRLPRHEPGRSTAAPMHICPDQDFIERAYDDAKYGRPSARSDPGMHDAVGASTPRSRRRAST